MEAVELLLRKYMSLIGIGAAKIDLQLTKHNYQAGETVGGVFLIEGGTIDQKINRIECELVMIDKLFKKEKIMDSIVILTSTVVPPQERSERRFSFKLPESLPNSTETVHYQFKTKLFFNEGVESKDQDVISIG